ncbi:MAG: S8 family serine peptidase [Chloroflexi bacterium]|nr:S8 family serine peptidase [Chloroflexota bacterium]
MKIFRKLMYSHIQPTNEIRQHRIRLKLIVGGLFIFLLINILVVNAQVQTPQPTVEIPLKSATLALENGRFYTSPYNPYTVIQLSRNLRFAEHQALRDQGVRLLNYLVDNTWIASVDPGSLTQQVINEYGLEAAVPWQPQNKAPLALQQGIRQEWAQTNSGSSKLLVTFFADVSPQKIEASLNQHSVTYQVYSPPNLWAVEVTATQFSQLMQAPIVHYMEEGPPPFMPLLDDARELVNVNSVHQVFLGPTPPVYNGLSGEGVKIQVSEGVWDNHPDFWNHDASGTQTTSRFLNPSPTYGSYHGTLVAGIIGGNGWLSSAEGFDPYQYRGMAPEASLYDGFASSSDIIHASNHSYVMNRGYYGSRSASVDAEINGASGSHPLRPQIWALGNQGLEPQYNDEEGYYSVYAPAKNAIGIGSVNANDVSLSRFSSMGPTFDGRIKPDVVAGGGKFYIPRNVNTVTIDWIRIINTSTNTVDAQWEFNTNGDSEGWLQTPSYQITGYQVANGGLTFTGYGEAYGHNYAVNLQASDHHVIEMRYKMNTQDADDPTAGKAMLYWHIAGDPDCPYVGGHIIFDVKLDNQFQEITIPVGTEGYDLICPGFKPDNLGGWTGTIDMLRFDPVRPLDGIVSTGEEGNGYEQNQGTSFAAPGVTGIVGLMLQQFVELQNINLDVNPPLPSTLKAILVQTATDLTHETADLRDSDNPDTNTPVLYYPGPDFATGYGLVNAQAAVDLIAADAAIDPTATLIMENELDADMMHMYEMNVAAGTNIKVTLAWDDVAADTSIPETDKHLVNDLDLLLIDPNGNWHYPWTLDPLPVADCGGNGPGCGDLDPISPSDIVPAYRGPDHLNNVEMAQIDSISGNQSGKWIVLILGWDVKQPMQSYSLISSHSLDQILTETELNNDFTSATPILPDTTMIAGSINPQADADYYAFEGLGDTAVILDMDAVNIGSQLDSVIHLYDANGVELAVNDDHEGLDSYIEYTLPQTGTYYLKVHPYDETYGGGIYSYYQLKTTIQSPEGYDIFLPFILRQ